MLYWALLFFAVACVAGIFEFVGIPGTLAGVAQILFVIFLALSLGAVLAHLLRGIPGKGRVRPAAPPASGSKQRTLPG